MEELQENTNCKIINKATEFLPKDGRQKAGFPKPVSYSLCPKLQNGGRVAFSLVRHEGPS